MTIRPPSVGTGTYAPLASPAFTGSPTLSGAPLPGSELGYSERTTQFTTTNTTGGSTAAGALPGLSVPNIVGKGLPVDIEMYFPLVRHSVANTFNVAYLLVNGVADTQGAVASSSTSSGRTLYVKRRLVLTNAVSYTFEAGLNGGAAGTITVDAAAAIPMYLAVTQR